MIASINVAEKKDCVVAEQEVEVQLVPLKKSIVLDTLLIIGLSTNHNESVLKLYFTNKKKSGGGNVANVVVKGTKAHVTFFDPNGKECK